MSGEAGSDVFLYWGSGSPPCWRVMLALEEKGLTGYQHKLLSFAKKEHKSDEVLKLNPRGQVSYCLYEQIHAYFTATFYTVSKSLAQMCF